jgi:hypothetical protein
MLISPKSFGGKCEEGLSFAGIDDYASEIPRKELPISTVAKLAC